MGLLPDTYNYGLHMRREWRERFPRHRLQKKPIFSDPGMHHGTCVTHVPWCMSGLLIRGGGEHVRGIPGACTTRNVTYLSRGPCCFVVGGVWLPAHGGVNSVWPTLWVGAQWVRPTPASHRLRNTGTRPRGKDVSPKYSVLLWLLKSVFDIL